MSVDTRFWLDRNVLVTGCSGLLGGWLSGALLGAGAHVIGLVRDQDPRSRLEREGIGRRMTLVYGDITDREAVERAVNEYEVATIFHLAAQTIVGTANRSPLSTFRCIAIAACSARSAWSSSAPGAPNAAITASPANFSTVPPAASISAAIAS